MRAFLESSYPFFTGLAGTPEQIDAARRAFRVFARRPADPEDPDGYAMPHTAITYLVDPDGSYSAHWPDTASAETVTADLRDRLVAYRPSLAGDVDGSWSPSRTRTRSRPLPTR